MLDHKMENIALGIIESSFLCSRCGEVKKNDEGYSKLTFNTGDGHKYTSRLCIKCSKTVLSNINSVFLGFEDDI